MRPFRKQNRLPTWLNPVIYMATGFLMCLVMTHPSASSWVWYPRQVLGHAKMREEKAWVLHVQLRFSSSSHVQPFLDAWGELADYCMANEPRLIHYEVMRIDKDPLVFAIHERYTDKQAYFDHKTSTAFKTFKEKMKKLQDSGQLVVTGDGFQELGIGFT